MQTSASTKHPPWQIRGVPEEEREAIVAAARRADMSVGDYVRSACLARIAAERTPNGAPVMLMELPIDLDRVERLVKLAIETAAPDRNDSAMRAARSVIRDQLAPLKSRTGKPPKPPKSTTPSLAAPTPGEDLTSGKDTKAAEQSHYLDENVNPDNPSF